MTASPRKTCVPGVHACATDGARTNTHKPSSATRAAVRHRERRGRRRLDAKALALAPNGTAQILELRLHRVVDGVTRAPDVVAHAIADLVARNRLPRIVSAVCRPLSAFDTQ